MPVEWIFSSQSCALIETGAHILGLNNSGWLVMIPSRVELPLIVELGRFVKLNMVMENIEE